MGFHNNTSSGIDSYRKSVIDALKEVCEIYSTDDKRCSGITLDDAIECGCLCIDGNGEVNMTDGSLVVFNGNIPDNVKLGKCSNIDVHGGFVTTLKGLPENVYGDLNIVDCKLTSLEGCPKWVMGDFYISDTKIYSLELGPTHVGGGYFAHRTGITSLKGLPEYLFGELSIYDHITDFTGFPKKCKNFLLTNNNI